MAAAASARVSPQAGSILVVVLLFGGFPKAFAALTTALHVPMTLFLLGVVFRGSAFTFRSYDSRGDRVQKRWGLVFSLASLVAPILLGIVVGTIASGRIRLEGTTITSGFFKSWLALFPFVVGLFALALFAFLAAVYLANEATDPALKDDFRRRAFVAGAVVGALALTTFGLSFRAAPLIATGLTDHPITWPLHLTTGVAAMAAFLALYRRRFELARIAAAAQAALIVIGWAASQYPYLIVPDLTLTAAAGNPKTQKLLLVALAAGSVLLFPSLYALYRVFKSGSTVPRTGEDEGPH